MQFCPHLNRAGRWDGIRFPPKMTTPSGDPLARFRLVRELGSGATGTVHEALLLRPLGRLRPGTRVAAKFLHQGQTGDEKARRRFLREARAGLAVRHRNLVRVHAVQEVSLLGQRFLYLVMEYVEGKTLRDLLADGPLAEALVRSIGRQVASALAALHEEGIVHSDVKPENVVLTKDGRVVLMDLGFARAMRPTSESEETGSFAGSVAYAAPERIRGAARPDPRSDLYSLGVLLHELAAGRRPFAQQDLSALLHAQLEEAPPPPSQANPRVSAFLDAFVARLLAKDPTERFASAKEAGCLLGEGERSAWWRRRLQEGGVASSFQLRHGIPLGGRREEMELLRSEWKRAKRGSLRIVTIEGAEGSGKSRLVDDFAARLRQAAGAPLTLYGRSRRLEEPTPFEPLLAALQRLLGLPRKALPTAAEERRLRRILSAGDARGLLAALGGETLASEGLEETLSSSFARLFAALAREGPTLLFLDDFSFADRGSLLALGKIAEEAEIPLLVLLAVRPESLSTEAEALLRRLEGRGRLARLRLGPLSPAALREVIAALLAPEAPIEEWADALEERGASNPSLLAEILRTLRDRGDFEEREGRWVPRVSPGEIPIPETAAEAIRQRRDLLEPEERALLECAAVAGSRFEFERLASAFELDPLKALQIFSKIERRFGLLVSAGAEFRFARPIVRETLYGGLRPDVREEAHRRLARQIEREARGKALPLRDALLLADHAAKGRDGELGLRVLPPLVERMRERGHFEQVRRLARLALEMLSKEGHGTRNLRRRFELHLRAAEAESRLGLRNEEKRDLEECARIATELDEERARAETFFHFGRYAFNTGKYLVALRFFERAEQLHEKLKDAGGVAASRLQRANTLSYIGDRAGAREIFAVLLKSHRAAVIQARAGLGLGRILAEEGADRAGLKTLERALLVAHKLRAPVLESLAHRYLGRVLATLGQARKALPHLEKGMMLARETGDRRTLCLLEIEMAGLLTLDKKRRKEAEKLLGRALATADEIQEAYAKTLALIQLAELKRASGAPPAQTRKLACQARSAAEEADLFDLQKRAAALSQS